MFIINISNSMEFFMSENIACRTENIKSHNTEKTSLQIIYYLLLVAQISASQTDWQTLKVYNDFRNEVATLINENRPAGTYEIEINPESSIKYPVSGFYLCRLQIENNFNATKMIYPK
jgi:hypothetical protein